VKTVQTLLPTLAINSLRAAHSGLDTQRAADLFLPTGTPRATVAFLHGWSDRSPSNYLAWIQHLTDSGVAVVFPRYQTSLRASRKQMLTSAEVSLREGLAELGDDCGPLILAGYSFGAGICVIAAAESEAWEIPAPAAIYGVFPYFVRGRNSDPLVITSSITVDLVVGDRDQVVGSRGAKEIARSIAPHPSTLEILRSTRSMSFGHFSVLQTSRLARRVFWRPLDEIVDRLAPV
jgi:predicted alpha/beta-hydrolase family hydrolase